MRPRFRILRLLRIRRWPRRRWIAGAAAAAVALGAGIGVWAYFSSTGSGNASASVGSLTAPTIDTATPGTATVSLTWSFTPPEADTVTYYVTRDGGNPGGNCPTAAAPTAVTSCTDSGVSPGDHDYTVTALWRTWTATSDIAHVTVSSGTLDHFELTAQTDTPTAGDADNLTITAKDAGDNTVTSYTGDKSLTFSGAATAPDGTHPTVTDKNGTAVNFGTAETITFASGVASVSGSNNGVMKLYKAETASIVVSDGTHDNGTGLSVTVSAGAAASLSLGAATTTPTAGVADDLTITAKDSWLNTATGYTGDKSLTFGGAANAPDGTHPTVSDKDGTAVDFGSGTTITFASGVASVSGSSNGVMKLYKAETASITVSDGSIGNGGGLSVTVGPGSAASLSLAAASTTPTAGEADNLTITAKDAYLNTATGYTGTKSLTFGGAGDAPDGTHPTVTNNAGTAKDFGQATAIDFSAGVSSVSSGANGVMKLYKAETASITVSDGSIGNGSGLSVTVAPGTAASLLVAAATTTPTAGQADNLTITARDTWQNTATGYTGDKSLTFGGAGDAPDGTHPTVTDKTGTARVFGAATTITFSSGVATVSSGANGVMKLYKAESATITVTDGSIGNTGVNVTVSPGTAASLLLGAATTTPTAGVADDLTITAKDSWLNTATGYTGTKSLTFGGAADAPDGTHPIVTNNAGTAKDFGQATAIDFSAGVSSVSSGANGVMKLYKAETASITVTDGSIGNGSGLSVTVAPGTAASLLVAAATTTPTAGVGDDLTITARDSWLNTATGYTGDKSLTFGGAANAPDGTHPSVSDKDGTAVDFGSGTTITFASGVASVSGSDNGVMKLYKAESATITVSDGSIGNVGLNVTVGPASAASLSLAAASTSPAAGAADNLTITAKDAYLNTATGYSGTKSLTFGGAGDAPDGTHPTVTNNAGTAKNFGQTTAIDFSAGESSVSSGANGVMKLYKAETASITVSDGSIDNGGGLSVTVGPGSAASFSLAAASTSPAAGEADNLTITAKDGFGNTATGYAGDKSLTFGGAANAPDGTHPTVSDKNGTAVNFGTAETITFASGVASVSGSDNGVMKLYKVETASITVSAGSIDNGGGLSVTVSGGSAASFSLAAASTSPTAGDTDNLTITAKDSWLNTATGYTGDKSLTFGGAANSPNGTHPTVSDKDGTAVNFGTGTTITFASGVASVSGSSNGVMKLYKAETASITVSEGSINNGSGLSVTVSAGSASTFELVNCAIGGSSTPCDGTYNQGNSATFTANINVLDAYGNTPAPTTVTIDLALTGNGSVFSFASGSAVTSTTTTITNGTQSGTISVFKRTTANQTQTVTLSATGYTSYQFTVTK